MHKRCAFSVSPRGAQLPLNLDFVGQQKNVRQYAADFPVMHRRFDYGDLHLFWCKPDGFQLGACTQGRTILSACNAVLYKNDNCFFVILVGV